MSAEVTFHKAETVLSVGYVISVPGVLDKSQELGEMRTGRGQFAEIHRDVPQAVDCIGADDSVSFSPYCETPLELFPSFLEVPSFGPKLAKRRSQSQGSFGIRRRDCSVMHRAQIVLIGR